MSYQTLVYFRCLIIFSSVYCTTLDSVEATAMKTESATRVKKLANSKNVSDVTLYFNFTNINITELGKNFISSSSVTHIDLYDNHIEKLDKEAFAGLPSLKYLNLARNPITLYRMQNLTAPLLETLILDGYYAKARYRDFQRVYYIGEALYFNSYKFSYSDENNDLSIFLPNLQTLSIRNKVTKNRQREDISEWLHSIRAFNLKDLDILGNDLSKTDPLNAFHETLMRLNVDHNSLTEFITDLPKLVYLSLERNYINHICNNVCPPNSLSLSGLPKLEYLSLAENQIMSIEDNIFSDLRYLRHLNLSTNKLSSLGDNALGGGLRWSLQNLTLSNNNLTNVPNLCELEKLQMLDLSGNQIVGVDGAPFCNLSNLHTIYLRSNNLATVADGTFAKLSNLRNLDLSRNKLAILPDSWLGSAPNLNSLTLTGNLFNDIKDMSLKWIVNMTSLRIKDNPLQAVTINSILLLPPNTTIDAFQSLCG